MHHEQPEDDAPRPVLTLYLLAAIAGSVLGALTVIFPGVGI